MMGANRCPSCGTKGRAVKPITIESLVIEGARRRVGRTGGFRFCTQPSCNVAYFHPEAGAQVSKAEVRVRIGQKTTVPPRPVCYCFEHTVEGIEAEVLATGSSKVADDITEKCREGQDHCEETNPQGACCLGDVRRVVREALARRAHGTDAVASSREEEPRCAVAEPAREAGRQRWHGRGFPSAVQHDRRGAVADGLDLR